MAFRKHTRPQRPPLALAALLAVLALIGVAGCGGSDDTSTSSTTTDATTELPTGTLSKAELAKTADQLCAESTARIADDAAAPEFGKDGPQPDEVKATAPFWSATAAEGQTLVDQLSQLQPPKDEQKQWNDFVDQLESGTVGYANALLGPAQDGDPDAFYQAAIDAQKELVKLAEASQALGMKVCGARDVPAS